MVALMVILEVFHNKNLHGYFYVSSNMWREIRSEVKQMGFPDELLSRLHRLRQRHKMKPGSVCMVDVDHIPMKRLLEIEEECKRQNISLMTHAYADSSPKHEVAKMIRERGEKILKGEIQADDTFVAFEDVEGKPTTGTNKVRR